MAFLVDSPPVVPPVGRCIYCDATARTGRLTKEHVIPKLLAGNLTLRKASCDACAAITRAFEGYVGRRVFQDVRLQHGFPMTERPSLLPMLDRFAPSPREAKARLVPTADHPGVVYMLNPEPAGMLTGKDPQKEFNGVQFFSFITPDHEQRVMRLKQQGLPTLLYREMEIDYLFRFIAKIALGIGVMVCGVDGFNATVIRRVIKKEIPNWHHFVGGTTEEMDEFPPPTGKNVLHRFVAYSRLINGVLHLIVQIQLLTYLNTPIYTVVVGPLNEIGISGLNQGDTAILAKG